MRTKFEEQLQLLHNSLIEMGGCIEYAIKLALQALVEQNAELAKQAIAYDDEIDDKEKEIESLCMKVLLQQQPVAKDLRLVSAALKMITDMERIGDHSADISEITLIMSGAPYIKELVDIPLMAQASIKMVNDSIDAFVKKDLGLAITVIKADDIVDDYFIKIRKDIIDLVKKDINNLEQAFDLMMIAKYLERIGDHATNIAEWVVFSLTGRRYYDISDLPPAD
jgi:phosphate transport system protein